MDSAADGHRRFDRFDDALDEYGVPVENRATMRQVAGTLGAVRFDIPPSYAYVAAYASSGPAVAYFHKGKVDLHTGPGTYRVVRFPVSYTSAGGARRSTPLTRGHALCPLHGIVLPTSGVCDWCDEG